MCVIVRVCIFVLVFVFVCTVRVNVHTKNVEKDVIECLIRMPDASGAQATQVSFTPRAMCTSVLALYSWNHLLRCALHFGRFWRQSAHVRARAEETAHVTQE